MKVLGIVLAILMASFATKAMVVTYHNAVLVNQATSECIGSYITAGIPRRDIIVNGSTCWVRK